MHNFKMTTKRLGGARGRGPTRNAADRPRSKRSSDPNEDGDRVKRETAKQSSKTMS